MIRSQTTFLEVELWYHYSHPCSPYISLQDIGKYMYATSRISYKMHVDKKFIIFFFIIFKNTEYNSTSGWHENNER